MLPFFFFPHYLESNLILTVTGFSETVYNQGVTPGALSVLTEDLNKNQGIDYFSVRMAFKGEN